MGQELAAVLAKEIESLDQTLGTKLGLERYCQGSNIIGFDFVHVLAGAE